MKIMKKLTALIVCAIISISTLNTDTITSDYEDVNAGISVCADGLELPNTRD